MKIFCLSLCAAALLPAGLRAADWPNWLGPDKNGVSREALPAAPHLDQVAWEAEIGIGFSSVSVSGGKVVAVGHRDGNEVVSCFSEADGRLLWEFAYEAGLMPNLHEGGPNASPALYDRWVYTLSKDGQLHCILLLNGKKTWMKDIRLESGMYRPPEWGFGGSPLIAGSQLIIEAGKTFSLDPKTGGILWQSEVFKPAYGTPTLFKNGKSAYLAALKTDGLVILDPAKGKTLAFHPWRTSFQTNANTPMAVDDQGRIFISTGYDRGCSLFRFDGKTLSQIYENQNMSNHMGNSVLIGDHIYGFDGTAHRGRPVEFACIHALTGEKKWRIEEFRFASLIAAGGDLIVLTEDGRLLIGPASPEGFLAKAARQVLTGRCWTPPVYANGRIYARNAAGKLVALKVD